MSSTMNIARTEARLFARDPVALFFGLVFPATSAPVAGPLLPGIRRTVAPTSMDRATSTSTPRSCSRWGWRRSGW